MAHITSVHLLARKLAPLSVRTFGRVCRPADLNKTKQNKASTTLLLNLFDKLELFLKLPNKQKSL